MKDGLYPSYQGLQKLRKIWKEYKNDYNWKKTLKMLDKYVDSKMLLIKIL